MNPRWQAAFVLLAVTGCREEPPPTPREVSAAVDLDDVRAAVLKRLYARAIERTPAQIVCVAVEAGDPTDRLLLRLSDIGAMVQKQSRCSVQGLRVVEPLSGSDAVGLSVSSLRLLAPGLAEAEGGYLHGPLAGRGMSFRLEFQLGRWAITQETFTWIS